MYQTPDDSHDIQTSRGITLGADSADRGVEEGGVLTGRSAVYVRVMFGYATDVAKSGSSPDQTWSCVHGHCREWAGGEHTSPPSLQCLVDPAAAGQAPYLP